MNLIEMYLNGLSTPKIAKELNLKTGQVVYQLEKAGIKLRSNKENYKTNCNHNYFSKIDSEAKAYYLGLLAADGQVQDLPQNSKLLRIDLIEPDIEIIEKFASELGLDKSRIKKYERNLPNHSVIRLVIRSDQLCSDLEQYNIVPRKTFIYSWPKLLNEELYNHFMRGYFDGDGCITNGPSFKICGTECFLLDFQQILMNKCLLNKTKLQTRHKDRNNNIRSMEYGGRLQVKRIQDFLYKNATIFLKRKRDKFNELL